MHKEFTFWFPCYYVLVFHFHYVMIWSKMKGSFQGKKLCWCHNFWTQMTGGRKSQAPLHLLYFCHITSDVSRICCNDLFFRKKVQLHLTFLHGKSKSHSHLAYTLQIRRIRFFCVLHSFKCQIHHLICVKEAKSWWLLAVTRCNESSCIMTLIS